MAPVDFRRVLHIVVVCSILLTSACAETPETSLAAAHRAWSMGDEVGLHAHLTGPSAGMMRLLAFSDARFRVVPRGGTELAASPVVGAPEGGPTIVARLPTAAGTVPVRLVRAGRTWLVDLVASEALSRDDGGRGFAP